MFVIDVTLKNNPLALSIERKDAETATAIYKQIVEILSSGNTQLIELECERQAGKKISVLSSEVSAVQISEKSTTTAASGRPPGFFALAQ